ncbi:sulfatase [Aurantiacibacter xanthus]|uniref:Sulfatase n=1 Tax=Aurantiacibacter xanthus TaxID=1784712 RepID=A0A3A1P4B3_9SPHN|nr:sulfatase-like hydrolase/transferase [Aurantiacibacter xanthus]RIV84129.1 sulfatase [Aurantiacibacter xanthus]
MKLNRRQAITAIGAASVTSACATARSMPMSRERPNILWIVSEDNNPFIGAYGDPLAHTPNIDAMARGGILYRNVYSNAPVCAPSRFCLLTGINPESAAPANHMRAEARLPDFIRTYPEYLRALGYYCTNNSKTDYNCKIEPDAIWDESSRDAHYRNRPEGAPFMAVFNTEITHESRLFGVTEGKVSPEDVRVPPYLPDSPEVRRDFASYYNLMEKMDLFVGDRLRELEEAGLAEDTIVFYYSDNGGCMPRSKRYCYEEGQRVAMVVHVPEKWRHLAPVPAGSEIAAPVSFIDFVPTLLSLVGEQQPREMPGKAFLGQNIADPKVYAFGMRNRMDERYDFIRTVTDGRYRYIRNYMPHRPWGQVVGFEWMLRSYQDWHARYLAGELTPVQSRFFEPKPYEEFYDLAADPDEIDNLAGNPGSGSGVLNAMRKALDEHMLAINDNGFIPEGSLLEGYVESRQPGAYPLAQVMALAARAAGGTADEVDALAAELSSDNEVIRYWAATGLLIRGEGAAPFAGAMQAALEAESSPQVRVVLAEGLIHVGRAEAGVTELARLLADSSAEMVRLQALNALTYVADPSTAMPAVEALVDDPGYLGRAASYLARVQDGTFDPHVSLMPPWREPGSQ